LDLIIQRGSRGEVPYLRHLHPCSRHNPSSSHLCTLPLQIYPRLLRLCCLPCSPSLSSMAPPIWVLDPFLWPWSSANWLSLEELVTSGQLTPAGGGPRSAWMVPSLVYREPNPTLGYVVSFIHLHERGFNAPASLTP
jgi:hypothetical protein